MGNFGLNFQFNGIVSPGGNIHPFVSKIANPAEHKFVGTRSENFASGSLGVLMSSALPFLLLDPWTRASWLSEKQYHILDPDSGHIQP